MRQREGCLAVTRQTGKRDSLVGKSNPDKIAIIFMFVEKPEDADLLSKGKCVIRAY